MRYSEFEQRQLDIRSGGKMDRADERRRQRCIQPECRFSDLEIDLAIKHFKCVIDGAENSNQAAEDALQKAYMALMGNRPER